MSETYAMTLDRSEYVQKRNQKSKRKRQEARKTQPSHPQTEETHPFTHVLYVQLRKHLLIVTQIPAALQILVASDTRLA